MVKKIFFGLLFFFACSILLAQTHYRLSPNLTEKKLPFGLTCLTTAEAPRTALVLSGGGSRAISQAGVLKSFESNNINFDLVVGTSMGSIIGGMYSSGYTVDQIDSVLVSAKWDDFFSLNETNRNDLFLDQKITADKAIFALRIDGLKPIIPKAFNTGLRVSSFLNSLTLNAPVQSINKFNELLFPFYAVSTDLITGKKVVLDKGSLSLAMRASSSVSFLLDPVSIDSLLLVDGGLVANVPVGVAADIGSDFIVAVNATSPLRSREELTYPWDIADQIVSIPMSIVINQNLSAADFVISPDLGDKKNDDFSDIRGLIDAGYYASESKIDLLKRKLKNSYFSRITSREIFFNNITFGENITDIERELILKYTPLDSVSSYEILYDISNLINTGDYKNITADVFVYANRSELKITAEKNINIDSVMIKGVSVLDENTVTDIFDPLADRPYNSKRILNAATELLRKYRAGGYSLANIQNINFDESSGKLLINIDEGTLSGILVHGNNYTDVGVIIREFKIKEGDIFKFDAVITGLNNLISTNLFEDIFLVIDKSGVENKLVITVTEKPTKIVRLGLRIDNENLTQVSIDMREENLFGSGTEVGAILSGGLRNRSLVFEHRANRVFDTYLTYKIRAFYEFNDVNLYRDDITQDENSFSRSKYAEYRQIFSGASLGIGTQVERFGNVFVEGKFLSAEIKDKSGLPLNFKEKNTIAGIKLGVLIDSQNKFPYPTSGFLLNSYYETAQEAFGGNVGYTKFSFDYTSIFTLDTLHTLSSRLFIGFADETLPLSQQFSLGGQNSFFGLRDNEFRGRQIFLASLEYRFDIPFQLFFNSYFRVRYDLGSIWSRKETIRFKDLRHGIGATLSMDTPIGPADFSFGKSFIIERSFPQNIISWGPYYFYFTIGYYY